MKSVKTRTFKVLTSVFAVALVFLCQSSVIKASAPDDKIETEELIKKHQESIGSAEARNKVSSIMAVGKSQAVSRGRNAGETTGIVVIASEGKKNLIGMKFDNNDYPFEKMGYDGDDFTVGYIKPGVRSILGEFLLLNEKTFKVGILGGALSTSWELLNYDDKVGKLKCGGTSKIDDIKMHKCQYNPKKGSDLKMTLYFHPETFRHVRTEYTRVISGGQGLSVDNSSRQNEKRYKIVEDFSDFKEVNGLTLPHNYNIYFEMLTGNGTTAIEWRMDIASFTFNQPIDAKEFKVDTY